MKPIDPIMVSLLWLGIEDYTGLWEALAEVREACPELTREEAEVETARLILDLRRAQFIRLAMWEEPASERPLSELRVEEVEQLVMDGQWWSAPQVNGTRSIRFHTTDAGFATYQQCVGWD